MRSGVEYVEGLRDGRSVYIDGERVSDVTTHPAFRGAVRSVAHLYDFASDPANREVMTYTSPETGNAHNVAFLLPHSTEDLARRRRGLRLWAEQTYGLMGRSPDHVAGFLTGFAAAPHVFDGDFAANVVNFHRYAAENDIYAAYTIVPPQIDRGKPAHQQADPHLYAGVKEERDGGIVIKGAQMLGTGAVLADWIQLSSIVPLRPGDENYAISVVVPVSAPGVKIFPRRSYAHAATSSYDYPLASRFDETDSLVVYDDVFVPWEHVFVYRDLDRVQAQWWQTPAWLLGNLQAQVRLATKLDLLTGVAAKVAAMNGVDKLPPVQGTLGELAAHATMTNGLVLAAEYDCELDDNGVAWPGSALTFANTTLQPEIYGKLLHLVRDLCGGGLIQLPATVNDLRDPEIAEQLGRYVQSPGTPMPERVKLLKLAWDLVGSEFASRHHQYEMFYAGAPFVVKMRMANNYDFDMATGLVDSALAGYGVYSDNEPEATAVV
ncbi:MAG: 4-hydroxyphenylacetate 3-hydroxylase [Streptosporangiales bacterium]|nr:4-hydroxyphenylacetate 3-hydroxylase [Streptosporangiales bacterium]